jgi:hypothetical protein
MLSSSAYVSIREQGADAQSLSTRQHTSAYVSKLQEEASVAAQGAYAQHTSAYVSIRQQDAYAQSLSIREHT